jgi:hypothetical protein
VVVRGDPTCPPDFDLLTIDDDMGGPYAPPAREAFPAALRAGGLQLRAVATAHPDRPLVVALYSDIRAWKARPGLSDAGFRRLRDALGLRPDALTVLFGHPRLATDLPGSAVLAAWGGEAVMQEAAALRLTGAA